MHLFEARMFQSVPNSTAEVPAPAESWTVLKACRKLGIWPEAPDNWIRTVLEVHLQKIAQDPAEPWKEGGRLEKSYQEAAQFLLNQTPARRHSLFLQEIQVPLMQALTQSTALTLEGTLCPHPDLLDPEALQPEL